MPLEPWPTAITQISEGHIAPRGKDIEGLIGSVPFSAAVYLITMGRFPTPAEARLIDAIMVSSLDHGSTSPSALAARTVASTRSSVLSAVAAGILTFSPLHAAAIEPCMHGLNEIAVAIPSAGSLEAAVEGYLDRLRARRGRFSGFGHRVHSQDPRVERLFSLAEELGLASHYINIARTVQDRLAASIGHPTPINLDGAIAALLAGMGVAPELSTVFFLTSRVVGLFNQATEETLRMKPMRRISGDPADQIYDGPIDLPAPPQYYSQTGDS